MGRTKVMIVEDHEPTLRRLSTSLVNAGYEVIARGVPIGASAAILRERPEVALVGAAMALVSGPAIIESVRASPLGSGTLLFLLAETPTEALDAVARQCGALGVIPREGAVAPMLAEIIRRADSSRPPRAATAPPELLVVGSSTTAEWARKALREHAVVRRAATGLEALELAAGRAAPDVILLGSGLRAPSAVEVWRRAARLDTRWTRRIVLVEEPEHPLDSVPTGATRVSTEEPVETLLERVTTASR